VAEKEREALEYRSAPDWLQKADGTRSTVPTLSFFSCYLMIKTQGKRSYSLASCCGEGTCHAEALPSQFCELFLAT